MRLQEQINKQNITVDHLASEILKLRGSGNKPDISQMKKALESKNKTIFDTLNVHQSCLDNILESLEKNREHLAGLKETIGVTSSTSKKQLESHRSDLNNVMTSIEDNCSNISKLNEDMSHDISHEIY